MPDKKATGAKPEDTPALVLDCQRRITLPNHVVRELKDAKSGLVEAKGRVKCAKDVLDYTNKIKRYILTAKIKGGKCHS
ncbi:uncharacterized protein QC763_507415 [Podospora pseudopauciseta]|uniref:Uncharacterized protein n=1 Tax=Podospora pseudopauciseta TaxID=2093780 RepID=A0ABR0H9E9_9PEZI|nr:hypothetical protein QC763_507415 [Podospora pseudopauciseta]